MRRVKNPDISGCALASRGIEDILHLWQLTTRLLPHVPRKQEEQQSDRSGQLASEIVEYARMVSSGAVVVWVPDLAYRLREAESDVEDALRVLKLSGIASRTRRREYWKIGGVGLSDVSSL